MISTLTLKRCLSETPPAGGVSGTSSSSSELTETFSFLQTNLKSLGWVHTPSFLSVWTALIFTADFLFPFSHDTDVVSFQMEKKDRTEALLYLYVSGCSYHFSHFSDYIYQSTNLIQKVNLFKFVFQTVKRVKTKTPPRPLLPLHPPQPSPKWRAAAALQASPSVGREWCSARWDTVTLNTFSGYTVSGVYF